MPVSHVVSSWRRRLGRGATAIALAHALASLSAGPAFSQGPLVPPPVDSGDELALPDIAAIEKGARSRASVSFGAATAPATPPAPSAPQAPEAPQAPNEPGLPAAPAVSGRSDNVKRLTAPPAPSFIRRSGIYGLESLLPPAEGLAPEDDRLPAAGEHVVRPGDTMTSVCEQYFADPGCWPKLWAGNPHVSNPHWLFPGDRIQLRRPGAAVPPPVAAPAPQSSLRRVNPTRRGSIDGRGVILREAGFIDKDALAAAGRVTGSREEKIMLASGDQAYVGFPAGKPLRAGERYTVFVADTANPVKNPDTGELLGYLVRVYGEILVDQVADGNVARGTLADLVEPVERGFAVSPRVRLFKQLEPRAATANLETRVVASFSPTILLAAENFVVLSRGTKDGLSVGNRVFVVRRGDGYRPIMEGWSAHDPQFPKEVVAELWVVDVRDKAAVAWVARSSKELRVGEVAELRKGH
jgi:LysM domain